MQLGRFTHQVAVAVPMEHYLEMSRRISATHVDHQVSAGTGYLLLVAYDQQISGRTWGCLLCGTRDQVLQPSLLEGEGFDDTGLDENCLQGWFHALIDTAVPIDQIRLEQLKDVRFQLQLTAEVLQRVGTLPVTTALKSEGAFDAEHSTMSLEVSSTEGLARRLAWLIEISGNARPSFQPFSNSAMDRFGSYLSRLHGKVLRRGAR